MSSAVKIEMTL